MNEGAMNFIIFYQRKFNLFYLLALIVCWINFKGGPPCVACLIVIKHLPISLLIELTWCEKLKVESTVTASITIWYHWSRKLNLIYKFRKKLERKCNFCIKILVFLFYFMSFSIVIINGYLMSFNFFPFVNCEIKINILFYIL